MEKIRTIMQFKPFWVLSLYIGQKIIKDRIGHKGERKNGE